MQRPKQFLFLTLKVFSATGGIEKVCRNVGKVLYETENTNAQIFSMYDDGLSADTKYFPSIIFKGFSARKLKFIYYSIKKGIKSDIIILSHINLLPVGYAIKLLSSKKKLLLFAHGVEVWKPLSWLNLKMLNKCDRILSVSNFTKQKLKSVNNIDDKKSVVLNNCIDPFLPQQTNDIDKSILQKKYGFTEDNFILITVTRVSSDEQYKGHDKVIESLAVIIKEFPNIRYLIVGKYDMLEKARLDSIIEKHNLQHVVVFSGFVDDEELPDHYNLADIFIMPSYGEGFGIAFIEAMFYKLPVIGGNKDGSTDALCNGKLGLSVDPFNVEDISGSIKKIILNRNNFLPDYSLLMQKFSFQTYKNNLQLELQKIYN